MPAFQVTAAGFETPRLPEARARVVEVWRSAFGENAQVDAATPDGLIVDTLALLVALTWEGIGGVWSRSFFQSADGVALDLLLDLFARRRFAASSTRVDLVWYGTDGTAIGSSSVAADPTTAERFATTVAGEIGEDGVCWVVTIDTVDDSQDYALTVDGNPYIYTSDGSATGAEIVAGLVAELQAGGFDAFGVVTQTDVPIVVIERASGFAAPTVDDGDMTVIPATRIPARAQNNGPVGATAGTVTFAITVISGVTGVVNPEDGLVGRLQETDAELRARHLLALSSAGRATPEAIRARLLDDVEGVTFARVVENESNTTDSAGRPPHSFETYVIGGDDDEIAQSIWESKPAGIRAYGSTVVQVSDSLGTAHAVGFSRPTTLYGHLRVTITPGEGYPTVGTPTDTARRAIADYLAAAGAPQLGVDFYRFALGLPVAQAVPGVAGLLVETDATAAPGDVPSFSNADLAVAEGEILDWDIDRITVLEV